MKLPAQSYLFRSVIVLTVFALTCLLLTSALADDAIFPPAAAAKPFIDFDSHGFLIQGKRTFLVSASIQYARIPVALWRDRLLRIKRAGFNTIQTDAFWNYHEPQEGKWEFTGQKDIGAFLKLVHELGLYAVVRLGPYIAAQWDSGGLPLWLRFKPGLHVREEEPQFLAAVDHWFEKIVPIVAANQIDHSGAVIMVQLEYEHPKGYGKETTSPYLKHLRDKALSLGLEVPSFYSGLAQSFNPAWNESWDNKYRTSPWYSTEFRPDWYNQYGPVDADHLRAFDRYAWNILAFGGNGFNCSMFCGGTTFDFWNDDDIASTYDNAAPIGQTGDLRPLYRRLKRTALFAQSLADVLEDSTKADADYKEAVTGDHLKITARKSQAGVLLFVGNDAQSWTPIQLKDTGGELLPSTPLRLAPNEVMPIVLNYRLLPNVTLECGIARILGISRQGDTTTLVLYSRTENDTAAPSAAYLRFQVPAEGVQILKGDPDLSLAPKDHARITLQTHFDPAAPKEFLFQAGTQKIRVLAVTEDWADRTWFVEEGGTNYVICGPDYVGEVTNRDGALHFQIEDPYPLSDQPTPEHQKLLYGAEEPAHPLQRVGEPIPLESKETPMLSDWMLRSADAPALSGVSTREWKHSANPLPMGADGDISPYAWYRATCYARNTDNYTLRFEDVGDWFCIYVNGKFIEASRVNRRYSAPEEYEVKVPLEAGANSLAVLTAHYGRDKLYGQFGPIDNFDVKGLNGEVLVSKTTVAPLPLTSWHWKPDVRAVHDIPEMLPTIGSPASGNWEEAKLDQDVFHQKPGFAWFYTTFPGKPDVTYRLRFENVDDNGTIYLNGAKVFHHEGSNQPFTVPLERGWKKSGMNEIVVLVENKYGIGGIYGTVEARTAHKSDDSMVIGWSLHGGIGDPNGTENDWHPLPPGAPPGEPTFYQTSFMLPAQMPLGPHPVLRVTTTGLSRGFVWLNGHNLGRFPEKGAMPGIWLPDCWLQAGKNTLTIFDEEGYSPRRVDLDLEAPASRIVSEWTVK